MFSNQRGLEKHFTKIFIILNQKRYKVLIRKLFCNQKTFDISKILKPVMIVILKNNMLVSYITEN